MKSIEILQKGKVCQVFHGGVVVASGGRVRCKQLAKMLHDATGDPWQNGSDFWYTRNHHGVGFWDRDYADEIADPLTAASHAFGEHDLCPEDFGLISKE